MIISIFLSRGGLGMPDTVAELYTIASQVLLERVDRKERGAATATAAVPHLTRLLQRVFFEAHVAQRRVPTPRGHRTSLGARARSGVDLAVARPENLRNEELCRNPGSRSSDAPRAMLECGTLRLLCA